MSFFKGFSLFIIGILLKREAEKRSFNRTNDHGVEEFESYTDLEKNRLIDIGLRVGGFICKFMGVMFLLEYYIGYKW
jgi:hypothetical protein